MKWTLRKRLLFDSLMTVLVLGEFAYQLTGNAIHEITGMTLFVLFIGHLALNGRWLSALFKGRYNGVRLASLIVNLLLLADGLFLIVSGIMNSNLLYTWIGFQTGILPRELHSASANGLLILMSLHLGLHWKMVMNEALPRTLTVGTRFYFLLPALSMVLAIYGIYASVERKLFPKLVAYYSFDHWDFDASIAGFFIQYIAMVGLYAAVAHYALRFFLSRRQQQSSKNGSE